MIKKCKNCNFFYATGDFCPECREKLIEAQYNCPKCKEKVYTDDKFCKSCGIDLEAVDKAIQNEEDREDNETNQESDKD